MPIIRALLALSLFVSVVSAQDDFTPLFNGKDLSGWEGDPSLWKVVDGTIVGTCTGPDHMANNSFLIWRAGKVKNFELRATVRVIGDNNSGIQYRSKELPEVAPWVITGYQCDIHPATEHTGMTYEERGRGIFGVNGKNALMDPEGKLWQLSQHSPVHVDVAQWHEYTITAKANHLVHQIDGEITSEFIDHDISKRAMDGLVAIQLHRGNSNSVEVRDLRIKVLPEFPILSFDPSKLPATAFRMTERPRTTRPQGTGPVQPKTK
jgi:Domain of Unknown Function (DUF1080)